MQLRRLSLAESLALAAVAGALIVLNPPTPHWRESVCQSCHLCGNRHVIVRQYRWWRLNSETVEPAAVMPVAQGHVHDWWQYAATFSSYDQSWAADGSSRYRDGRNAWSP